MQFFLRRLVASPDSQAARLVILQSLFKGLQLTPMREDSRVRFLETSNVLARGLDQEELLGQALEDSSMRELLRH